MSDYHIIEGNNSGEEYRIVYHVTVPNEMNRANTINIREAIKEDPLVIKTSVIPWISVQEQEKLTNGELIELKESFRPDPNKTLAQNREMADNRFQEIKITVRDSLRARYGFWRFERNV